MSFRTIAAGAGVLAALTFAETSTAPAEPGGAKPSATHTRAAKPPHRVAKPHRTAKPQRDAKGRHGKRTRVARHRHRQPTDRTTQNARRPLALAQGETPPPVRQETSAERRFREFLNPQSFAAAVNEQLRTPRLLAANFSGDIAEPGLVLANAPPVETEPRAEAPPSVARDQTTSPDGQSKAAPLTQSDPVPVQRAAQIEKEPDGMSFLGWFFIAWGGVLTLASAVRMAIG